MKKKITKLMAALALLVFMAPSMVMWGQTRAEVVAYTLDGTITGSGSNYATGNSITQDEISWVVTGNTTMSPWRIGGKSISNVDRPVYSTDPIADNITKIEVTHGTASGITVNSWTVIVASDASFSNVVSTLTPTFTASATTTINRPTGADWTNCYYKFIYNVTVTQTSNKFLQFVSAEFYKQEGSGPVIATPTFSPAAGTYIGTQSVTISCETGSSTIYYTTDGSTPDNNSMEYTGAITVSGTTTIMAIAYVGTDASSVASATYNILDLEHAGTEADPYSVADALAAIDAETGTQGVYATGIVSAIPTAWSSQYNNITFNFVDNEGDTDFLQAYRCGNGTGVDASELAVGDIVVVYGNLTKYGSTYEFGSGCQLVSLTHPSTFVEAPTFSPAAGTFTTAQTVTISCATTGASIYYTTDGTEPDNTSTQYTTALTISTTTTIKAIAYDGTNYSNVSTASYHFCSADDPYSVTEALAFNNYPANNIYVHGIVSTAPTQSPTTNGELTYYISADGAATDQLEVYKGKGLEQAAFTSQDDIQVGDIVTVFGTVQIYNSTIEFASGNYLVAFERPQNTDPTVTIDEATVTVPAEGGDGTVTVSYTNFVDELELDVEFYEADGTTSATYDWITYEFDTDHNVVYTVQANSGEARTAYFKVWETSIGVPSNLVTVNQAAYTIDYAELPFAWAGGERSAFEALNGTSTYSVGDYGENQGVYRMKLDGDGDYIQVKCDQQPGKVTIGVKMIGGATTSTITVQGSADGETFNNIQALTISGSQNTELILETTNAFASTDRYVRLLFAKGSNVGVGPINIAVVSNDPVIVVTNNTIALDFDETSGEIEYSITNPVASSTLAANTEATWISNITVGSNAVTFTCTPNESTESRTATITLSYQGAEDVTVTVNQAAYVAPPTGDQYVLYTGELVEGDYVICYNNDTWTAAMKNEVVSSRLSYEEVTPNNHVVITDDATIIWHIAPSGDFWTIYSADADAYAAGTGVKNKAQMLADGTDDLALWTVSGTDVYEFVNKGNAAANVNAYLRNNTTYGFACYAATTGGDLSLYKKVTTTTETYPLEITGYPEGSNGNWFLIASPVAVDPATVSGMILTGDDAANYDLYAFDESEEQEWRNYKQHPFTLEPGKGYLYAQKATTPGQVFHFDLTGTPYDGAPIKLQKTDGGDFPGWNLIGNPLGETAYIEDGRAYYIMNSDGTGFIENEGAVNAMQGIFVIANQDEEEITFTTTAPTTKDRIVLNVSNNRGGILDRAVVRFGEGQDLPKFQFNENSTKISIEENSNEYAMVYGANEGTMPVIFKAEENGNYTINFQAENAEFSYFHLVDNMTGADVNLLENPSYSFDAQTTDFSSRFKVVYAKTNTGVSEHFAFVSNGDIIVNGQGTLQVVDVAGRIVATYQDVNSISTKGMTPGVYVLQLIGNEVKTQKIVVE